MGPMNPAVDPEVETWLKRFERLSVLSPGPVPWSVQVKRPETHEFNAQDAGHIVIGSCVHGVETGSLPAVVALLEECQQGAFEVAGTLTVFLGNPAAVRQGTRFVEADLNRVFSDEAPDSLERRRAAELKPLLAGATLFVDFHQTNQPSATPFFIFGYHEESYLWARLIGGSNVLVTRDGRKAFSEGSLCGDEFCRARGIPALTLELGEKGIRPEATRIAYETMRALLAANVMVARGKVCGRPTLAELAASRPEFGFYNTIHQEPFTDGRATLLPGLHNFTPVSAGQALGTLEGKPIAAPTSGVLLFPKYPRRDASGASLDPVTGDLFHLAVKLETHPRQLWGFA